MTYAKKNKIKSLIKHTHTMGIDNRNPILIMFTIIVLEEGGGDIIYIARVYISHDIWCGGGFVFIF